MNTKVNEEYIMGKKALPLLCLLPKRNLTLLLYIYTCLYCWLPDLLMKQKEIRVLEGELS
jgi:hypothetical protein